ncbi:type II secretion system F family protein [Nesterenkonia alba]|uniref:type II secretion system F family protein n=1 Tax=Nesterenkonia alba TaxID=515814 RepID=UPI0003B5DE70|nr:type II secretion system F family protein [Nesterenkonia alba]
MIGALAAAAFTMAAVLLLLRPSRPSRWQATGWWSHARGSRQESCAVVDAATLLDLTAALLTAGVGIEAALDRLARSVSGAEELSRVHRALAAGTPWDQAAGLVGEDAELSRYCAHLRFAYATGAPSADMLEAAAAQARAERRHEAERAAAELGVKMMLPLGACFLPAFILLGVVPVILSMVPEAFAL